MANSGIIVLTTVVGVLTLGFGIVIRRAFRSVTWPSTKGQIQSCDVVGGSDFDGGERYQLKVKYRYVVSGKEYHGNQIGFFGPSGGKLELMRICEEFPEGKEVEVYFDPKRPIYAILTPGVKGNILVILVVIGVLHLFVVFGWWVELR